MEQLEFFEEDPVKRQGRELQQLRADLQKLRKAQFREIAVAKQMAYEATMEIMALKQAICHYRTIYPEMFLGKCG